MVKVVEYAVTWLFFMAIIVGLCLITPKVAKKIDQWREAKKQKGNNDSLLQPLEQDTQPNDPEPHSESKE